MRDTRVKFGRPLNPHYTDVCVVIGPDVRWTEDDVSDLQQAFPEVLLGYRVVMTTVADVNDGYLRGMRPSKFVVLDGCDQVRGYFRALDEIMVAAITYGAEVEHWEVYRHNRYQSGSLGVITERVEPGLSRII